MWAYLHTQCTYLCILLSTLTISVMLAMLSWIISGELGHHTVQIAPKEVNYCYFHGCF